MPTPVRPGIARLSSRSKVTFAAYLSSPTSTYHGGNLSSNGVHHSANMFLPLTYLNLGAVECLEKELALLAPGIKVLIVEPGYFRTSAFSNINHVPARVPDYAQFNAGVRAVEAGIVGNEPGDAAKAVSVMIDLVNGTGVAAGKTIPLRVPLGSDGWERIRAKAENMAKICDEWEEVAKSTDIKG